MNQQTVIYPARLVRTMDPARPVATAIAVRDGLVRAVGSVEELGRYPDTMIDGRHADKVLLPGFVEAHAHAGSGRRLGGPGLCGVLRPHRPRRQSLAGVHEHRGGAGAAARGRGRACRSRHAAAGLGPGQHLLPRFPPAVPRTRRHLRDPPDQGRPRQRPRGRRQFRRPGGRRDRCREPRRGRRKVPGRHAQRRIARIRRHGPGGAPLRRPAPPPSPRGP